MLSFCQAGNQVRKGFVSQGEDLSLAGLAKDCPCKSFSVCSGIIRLAAEGRTGSSEQGKAGRSLLK